MIFKNIILEASLTSSDYITTYGDSIGNIQTIDSASKYILSFLYFYILRIS